MSKPRSLAVSSFPTRIKGMKAGRLDFGHDELLRRNVRALNVWRKHRREAVNPGWGAWVVGFFTAVCMSA